MAGKSLLQQFGWSCKYKVKELENLFSVQPMEGSFRKSDGSDNGPPSKKRKTEDELVGETEGLWDDSIELTEDDLDNIELQASQAMTQTRHDSRVGPSTSTTAQRVLQPLQQQTISEQSKFLKPQLSRSSSSSASSKSHSLQSNSSVSSQSKTSAQSSRSSYPESLSGYSKTTSSSSVRSGSSAENVQGQISSSRSRLVSEDASVGSQATVSELTVTKQECASLKLQLENLREEVDAKGGENQVLRDNLTKKDTELDTLKMEKISQIHQHNIHQSEREKSLQTELAKLQTQLQFKSQEERESSNRCKELQVQMRNLQAAGPSTSQGFLSTQSVSPRPSRVYVEERSPQGKSRFPSQRTFMAEEVSPVKRSQPTFSGDNQKAESSVSSRSSLNLLDTRQKCGLKLRVSTSTFTGSQLVSRLFDIAPSKTGSISDRGILGLLSSPSTNTGSYRIQFERDKNTSLLSPIRGRRLSDLHGLLTRTDKPNLVNLVSIDHFNMAVQGLSSLTRAENQSADSSLLTSGQMITVTQEMSSKLQDAVLVLPVINDYLKHYIEMLEAALDSSEGSTTTTTTLSSSSSGSFDTSSESLTGSFGLFVKCSASWANDLECLAIASVETLYELLSSPAVKDILLHTDTKQSPQTPSTTAEFENSDSDMDIQWKDTPTKLSYVRNYVSRLQILKKILKLTSPGTRTRLCNARIVTGCLDILKVLAINSDEKQITCLLPVFSDESLQNCLDHETDTDIVIHSLQLFKTLLKSNQVVSSLCSNATGCVLLTVYNLCLKKYANTSLDTRLLISSLIIDSILYLASSHRGCFTLVLESDCLCSAEVVKSAVTLLHSVMKIHKMCASKRHGTSSHSVGSVKYDTSLLCHHETSLKILQNGLQLLHLMSQLDSEFINRHIPVQYNYVQLICGMTHIFRDMENNDSELNAVQDLWDFCQDDSELYSDEPMDQQ